MSDDDSINDRPPPLKEMAGVVQVLLDKAGDSEDLMSAGKSLARTTAVVAETVETALLPLVAINIGAAKARAYFNDENGFKSDIVRATRRIKRVVEPKATAVGPAMQGLAYAHEEQLLKDMYVSLIAAAMDADRANKIHPSFSNILGQLSADEAALFKGCIEANYSDVSEVNTRDIPIVSLSCDSTTDRKVFPGPSNIINVVDIKTGKPTTGDWVLAAVSNWQRLGLVEISYDHQIPDNNAYNWVAERPEYKAFNAQCPSGFKIRIKKGVLYPSLLGVSFMDAVGLPSDE